jgi:hypothetical protein
MLTSFCDVVIIDFRKIHHFVDEINEEVSFNLAKMLLYH